MRIFYEIARYLVGGLFIFSGAIKVNDPVGTAIKLQEYFEVFAYDFAPFFEYFIPAALFLSVVLSVLEVVLGIALIMGYKIPVTSWVLLAIIVFFTFLTFYSAYFNKVTDCGCFGDAIKLTPWQSFYKDIVLLVLILVIFINRKKYDTWSAPIYQHIQMVAATALFTFLAVYAIAHLPYIDFRAYAVGKNLPAQMEPSEELRYEYVMEKDGREYKFESYPTDKSYEFKSMDLVNPEAQPKITDLGVWNDDGEFTEQLLTGNKLLVIVHDASKASRKQIDEIKELIAAVNKAEAWVLTASGYDEFEAFRHDVQLALPYFYADATVLKTMVRSNPGIMLLADGTVMGKWHYNDVPSAAEVNRILF